MHTNWFGSRGFNLNLITHAMYMLQTNTGTPRSSLHQIIIYIIIYPIRVLNYFKYFNDIMKYII